MDWEARYPAAKIVPYDASWPARFAELAGALRSGLGTAWMVEHVGSTSVPGLIAKPVIDLAVRVPDGRPLADATDGLAALGWTEPVALGDHAASLLLDGQTRRAIAHLFTSAQWPEAHVRLFADWLRRHPADRDAYARLKTALVNDGVWGSDYTQAKAAFVEGVVVRAREELGLRPKAIL